MALNCPPERALNSDAGVSHGSGGPEPEFEEVTVEEKDLEELADEVHQMATKIQEYRATLPDQLKTTLASLLSSQRPLMPNIDSSEASGPESIPIKSSTGALRSEEEDEKVKLLKEKLAKNASSMPLVLKRMKDCMSKMENLEESLSSKRDIHPAFKKKRNS
ncbi:hypothetical protein LINPERPRIM_LOCUS27485 [Linum perenne]